MLTASNTGSRTLWRSLSTSAGIALVTIAVACGGGSDLTAPPVGGGGGAAAVATVGVSPASANLLVSVTDSVTLGTTPVSATPKDASGNVLTGRAVTWSSSSTSVATVSSSGVVTAVGAGSATITATSEGQPGHVSITVTRPAVSTVTMTPANATLLVGVVDNTNLGATTLIATPNDAGGHQLSGRAVAWISGTASVATVSSTGAVKAIAPGSASVNATIEGQTGSVPVTVTRPPVTQVSVVPQTSSIKVGATETLVVTLLDSQGHALTGNRPIVEINNSPSIVTVYSGQITGVAAGTATVSYTSENNATTVATITVTP